MWQVIANTPLETPALSRNFSNSYSFAFLGGIFASSLSDLAQSSDLENAVVRLTLKSDCSIVRSSKGEKGWHRLVFGWMMT